MSDPYYHPPQTYLSPGDAAFYSGSSEQQQDPVYGGYEAYPARQEQGYQDAYSQPQYNGASNLGQSYGQPPAAYLPQTPETQNEYQSPASAIPSADPYRRDKSQISTYYEPHGRGSNAEYYESASLHERSRPSTPRESSSFVNRERGEEMDTSLGGERGLGGALAGGAAGFYLGHKKSHGLLGAAGGALLGHFLENKIEERRDSRHGSHHGHHHGRRRTRHHHHHHHGSRSRSRSMHSHRSTGSYSGGDR